MNCVRVIQGVFVTLLLEILKQNMWHNGKIKLHLLVYSLASVNLYNDVHQY